MFDVAFYDQYWRETWQQHITGVKNYLADEQLEHIYRIIVGRLGARGTRMLDVGGGISRLAMFAKDARYVPKVIDFSPFAVSVMQGMGISAMVADIERWDGRIYCHADVTTCTEVLEHVENPARIMQLCTAHAPHAFFTAPNDTLGPEECATHRRKYTVETFTNLVTMHYSRHVVETYARWMIVEAWL